MITSMHGEQENTKEQMQKIEKEVNEVDFNAKKKLEEVNDKIEVDRCVFEMVSWVSEQLTNVQVVQNLNKVAKKVNDLGKSLQDYTNNPGQPVEQPSS